MNDPANGSDEELLASLSAGDDLALAVLAGRHARPVFDFALRASLDRRRALDVAIAAFRRLASLRPGEPPRSVRSWLLNAAALEILAASERTAAADTPPDDSSFSATGDEHAAEAAEWAWEAALALRLRDYCLLDLNVRRGLGVGDIDRAIAGRSRMASALSRAVAAFEQAYVAAALTARGGDACGALRAILARGRTRAATRREIAGHAVTCGQCLSALASLPPAVDALAAIDDVDPPPELPDRIFTGTEPAPAPQLSGANPGEAAQVTPVAERPTAGAMPDSASEGDRAPEGLAADREQPAGLPIGAEDAGGLLVPAGVPSGPAAQPGLARRLEALFEPATGRRFLWSYAVLGAATALAVYLGIAVADSIRGGGKASGAVPLGSGLSVATAVPCDQPTSLVSGEVARIELDSAALAGYEITSASVVPASPSASAQLLSVRSDGPASVQLTAAQVEVSAPRADEYRLRLELRRGDRRAVTDCRVFVAVGVR